MTNWFYNEVEMRNQQKKANRAAANYRRTLLAKENGGLGMVGRAVVFFGRQFVNLHRHLQDQYNSMPADKTIEPKTAWGR